MPGSGDDSACQLIEAVRQGRIAETLVDERVHQLLELVMTARERKQDVSASFEENHQLALKAAEESIVLLKNEGNILPIAKNAKIAAIGNFIRRLAARGQAAAW